MDLAEILSFVKANARLNNSELNDLLKDDINRAYQRLARKRDWPQLRVEDETFDTTSTSPFYHVLPYAFDRLEPNSLRYDYAAGTKAGTILPLLLQPNAALYRAAFASTAAPLVATVTGGSGSALYATGTVSVTNRATALSGSGTNFTSALEGEWIVFHSDSSGNNGQDYGYEIATVNTSTALTLAEAYRGPDLSGARYEIRPAASQRLRLDPAFTDSDVTCLYSYFRKPRRLYNDEDTPEVPQLAEAIAWTVLASNAVYHNENSLPYFNQMARQALVEALTSCP